MDKSVSGAPVPAAGEIVCTIVGRAASIFVSKIPVKRLIKQRNQNTPLNACQNKFLRAALALVLCSLSVRAQEPAPTPGTDALPPGVLRLGRIANPRITESSGVVASRQFPGMFWTHNDGGGARRQVLYGITREGASVGEFTIAGIALQDWEDLAIDDQNHLFIGDIGNNDGKRTELAVYQLDEPDPKAGVRFLQSHRSWRLRFPGKPFDCESLFVWQDHGYIVSKVFDNLRAQIFRFPLKDTREPLPLELVATTKIESPVTGADISPDGQLLALVAKSGAFVYRIDGDVSKVIKAKPHQTKLRDEHIEGCCFVPDGLLATSENRSLFLFTARAFHWK